jgi:NADP-dependent 3-hydroxy acid dehydrogenase YdfG
MTPRTDLANSTTMVVGASRGLGRGIATAFAEAGAPVIAVARSETALNNLARAVSGIHPEVADAGDPSVAGSLIDRYDPTLWF